MAEAALPGHASAAAAPWDGVPREQRGRAIAAIWLAIILAVLDASIANVALPAIAHDLKAAASESIWIVNAYQLTILVSLLPLAALGEILEYRRVFMGGLVLFVIASLACAVSSTLPELAAARALQGLGAAGIMSVNGALLRFTAPRAELGKYVGLNALVVSVASVIGPTLASGILSLAPWPWLFAVNLPIGVLAIAVGRSALPASPRSDRRLDAIATVLNIATFGLLVTGVDLLTRSRLPLLGAALATAGLIAGVTLVRRSLAEPRPLAPVDLMRNRLFALTVLTSIASFAAQALTFVALPFHLQLDLHRSQVATGLLITPWPLAVGVAAPFAGRLADRYPAAILSGVGLGVMALGLVLLAMTPADASALDFAWRMALCGAGFGFFQSPNNRTLLSAAPLERSGAAGGMLATARLVGQTAGATVAAILFHMSRQGPVLALEVSAAVALAASVISFARLSATRS